jgi:hypothetical protein
MTDSGTDLLSYLGSGSPSRDEKYFPQYLHRVCTGGLPIYIPWYEDELPKLEKPLAEAYPPPR